MIGQEAKNPYGLAAQTPEVVRPMTVAERVLAMDRSLDHHTQELVQHQELLASLQQRVAYLEHQLGISQPPPR